MTDDTLREECETLLDSLDATYPDVMLGGTLADVGTKYKADIAKLLAFARAQQAKGLREAAELIQDSMKPGAAMPMREQMIDYLLNHAWALEHQKGAQATAREAERGNPLK